MKQHFGLVLTALGLIFIAVVAYMMETRDRPKKKPEPTVVTLPLTALTGV